MHTEKAKLVSNYIRSCWIIKIRLISSRRQLWGNSISLIHLENCCIQLRKICEGLTQLCLLASEIKYRDVPKRLRKRPEVGKVISHLRSIDKLHIPARARLGKREKSDNEWQLDITQEEKESDIKKVIDIWNRTGRVLHEKSAFGFWPISEDQALHSLLRDLNAMRLDHQFLWNYLWQHHIKFDHNEIFFIDFGSFNDSSRPFLVKSDNFLNEDVNAELEPNYIADFEGEVDWNEFSNE